MSIVTKTGDAGTTSLMYNRRVSKRDPRVDAGGNVDELNAALGLARALSPHAGVREELARIQQELIGLMGELATDPADAARYRRDGFASITTEAVDRLDRAVREIESSGVIGRGWATPGQTPDTAALDLARAICRRAERAVCALFDSSQAGNEQILVYLNRLSDLLWLRARWAEARTGTPS